MTPSVRPDRRGRSRPADGRPRLVVVCGATASGKTGAAIELAQHWGGEIIGADSVQLYRHMEIGSAKPTAAERARVRHHLVDVVDPATPYDAARFARAAGHIIARLTARGTLPFMVGGTGLYIKALLGGLFDAPAADPRLRSRLRTLGHALGGRYMHTRLRMCDPQSAARLHPNDLARLIRALEVYLSTGRPLSHLQRQHRFARQPYRALRIGLAVPRERLYRRIDRRVEAMLAEGLLDEVRRLRTAGYGPELKSMQALGYRHMSAYLDGRLDWDEAVRTLKRDTRRYAKRQLTWFGADPEVRWVAHDDRDRMHRLVAGFLNDGMME